MPHIHTWTHLLPTAIFLDSSEAQNIKANDVDAKKVTLTPYSSSDFTTVMAAGDYVNGANKPIRTWKCSFDGDNKYVPASCRNVASAP